MATAATYRDAITAIVDHPSASISARLVGSPTDICGQLDVDPVELQTSMGSNAPSMPWTSLQQLPVSRSPPGGDESQVVWPAPGTASSEANDTPRLQTRTTSLASAVDPLDAFLVDLFGSRDDVRRTNTGSVSPMPSSLSPTPPPSSLGATR